MNPTTGDIMNFLYSLEERLVKLDNKIDKVESNMVTKEELQKVEIKITNVEVKLLAKIEENSDNLVREIIDVMVSVGIPIQDHQKRLDNHEERIGNIESQNVI